MFTNMNYYYPYRNEEIVKQAQSYLSGYEKDVSKLPKGYVRVKNLIDSAKKEKGINAGFNKAFTASREAAALYNMGSILRDTIYGWSQITKLAFIMLSGKALPLALFLYELPKGLEYFGETEKKIITKIINLVNYLDESNKKFDDIRKESLKVLGNKLALQQVYKKIKDKNLTPKFDNWIGRLPGLVKEYTALSTKKKKTDQDIQRLTQLNIDVMQVEKELEDYQKEVQVSYALPILYPWIPKLINGLKQIEPITGFTKKYLGDIVTNTFYSSIRGNYYGVIEELKEDWEPLYKQMKVFIDKYY
ncbi:hypothetical protein OW763_14290 [Clostridium aestuarii]|uniref:Uncharacterized protein n=1 Tax=Clostridium aestuarii TaxID=338193 RepID=A0ABT4D5M8_9CLOT|nr:hypothetical protein [Clostridium aestuarii]MCY6485500.1 hypothetical protein [Clostridium aestuarii]